MATLLERLNQSNIGGGKFIEIVDIRNVDVYHPPIHGTITDEVELVAGAEWDTIRFTDETLHFHCAEDRSTGDKLFISRVSGITAKDRLEIHAVLEPFVDQRVMVKFHNLNDDILLLGSPDEPLELTMPERDHQDQYRKRNQVAIEIRGSSRKTPPFYGEAVYEPPVPGDCDCDEPADIAYQFGYLLHMGERTSYGAGSEGNLLANGWFDHSPPEYPETFQQLDSGHANPWLNLESNNAFGNTNRFTDDGGAQTYANDLVIDHLTGLMWYRTALSADIWSDQLSTIQSSTQGGYEDWEMPTEKVLESILDYELGTNPLNYSPFSISATDLWTCTTSPSDTTKARRLIAGSGNTGNHDKTSSLKALICRKHYV